MIARLLTSAAMLLPLSVMAAEPSEGEKIFNAKCSQCHTFSMAQAMLDPVTEEKRPGHLAEFLKTHPPKLDEHEKEVVIKALSSRAK